MILCISNIGIKDAGGGGLIGYNNFSSGYTILIWLSFTKYLTLYYIYCMAKILQEITPVLTSNVLVHSAFTLNGLEIRVIHIS